MSAVADDEFPHQGEKRQKGFFITEVAKWLKKNPEITPKDLGFSVRKVMKKNGYSFVLGTSNEELLLIPFLQ
jgi:hypothetical protein